MGDAGALPEEYWRLGVFMAANAASGTFSDANSINNCFQNEWPDPHHQQAMYNRWAKRHGIKISLLNSLVD